MPIVGTENRRRRRMKTGAPLCRCRAPAPAGPVEPKISKRRNSFDAANSSAGVGSSICNITARAEVGVCASHGILAFHGWVAAKNLHALDIQKRIRKICVLNVHTIKVGRGQECIFEDGTLEVRVFELNPVRNGIGEVGTLKVAVLGDHLGHDAILEGHFGKVSLGHQSSCNVLVIRICACHFAFSQILKFFPLRIGLGNVGGSPLASIRVFSVDGWVRYSPRHVGIRFSSLQGESKEATRQQGLTPGLSL
mmetsp:Transcript_63933/g.101710  ORF Transcript_63933/g.101710 Transcript_63933/m.101710 type:complete len:251 (+) Transcript_63933:36-788(+)